MEELEIWKDIIGYEGLYQVSNFGRVKRLPREKILKQLRWKKNWYTFQTLSKNGVKKQFQIHRIVASVFINNTQNKPEINHKNGIKDDNRVENLEWCTSSENSTHSYATGLQIAKSGRSHHLFGRKGSLANKYGKSGNVSRGVNHYQSKCVLNKATGIFYDTIKDASNSVGCHYSALSRKLLGKRKNNTDFILV